MTETLHPPDPLRAWLRHISTALAVALVVCLAPTPSNAQDEDEGVVSKQSSPIRASARSAFGGHYRSGRHVAVTVDMENRGPDRRVAVQVSSSVSTRVVEVDLASGGRKSLQVIVQAPNYGGFRVRIVDPDSEEMLAKATPQASSLPYNVRSIAFVGVRPPGLKASLMKEVEVDGDMVMDMDTEQPRVSRVTASELPESWLGYQSLDALIWLHPRFDQLTTAQATALERWIMRGGHLSVSVDETWRRVAGHPLAKLLPVKITGMTVVEDGDVIGEMLGLGGSFGGENRTGLVELPERLPILDVVARSGAQRGIESVSANMPLTLTWPVGDGRVTIWKASPERTGRTPTLNHWETWLTQRTEPFEREHVWNALRAEEPKLDFNIGFLLLVLVAYLIIIGPVDYLVLRKMGRLEWTVVTYPAAIALFSGLAWLAMTSSVDSNSVELKMTFMTWHLPGDAITGVRSAGVDSPSGGVQDISVLGGFFPTERQRLTVQPDEQDANIWLDSSHYAFGSAFSGSNYRIVGHPAQLEVVAPAYAMLPVEKSIFRRSRKIPITIEFDDSHFPTEPNLKITNQSALMLKRCWVRVGDYGALQTFELLPGKSVVADAFEFKRLLANTIEGWEVEDQFLRNLSSGSESERHDVSHSEMICLSAPDPSLDFGGVVFDAEELKERHVVRFTFHGGRFD